MILTLTVNVWKYEQAKKQTRRTQQDSATFRNTFSAKSTIINSTTQR
jgi:hypothetical protein